MAMLKYGHAVIANSSISPDLWANKVYKEACADGKCRLKTAKSIVAQYNPDKYLLSHVTIIAAVDVDDAPDSQSEFKDYLIKPEYSKFVNNNGDAWTKTMLDSCYKTFVGGENYLEHVQIPELSKGKIIDAAKREVVFAKDKNGKDLSTYYVDILVATDRQHKDLVRKIEAKELTTLSMGCRISYSLCSKCGRKAVDETEACEHVRFQKNNTFFDHQGTQRKIAELCGHYTEPESVKFIEASWVAQPAFTGAVLRSFVEPDEKIMAKLEEAKKIESYKKKPGDFIKAAGFGDILTAQDEEVEPPKEEEEPPAEDTEEPTVDAPEETPAEPPAEEEPPAEDVEDLVKDWKKDLKKQVMKQITDEVLKDLSEEDNDLFGPGDTESLDETLIRPASLVLNKVWGAQKTWDRFVRQRLGNRNLEKKLYDKLRYGVHIAMTNSDLTALKDYGYSKRDAIAVLSFLDGCLKKPLPTEIKRIVANMGGTNGNGPVNLLKTVVAQFGRKLTTDEARRVLSWLKLLDYYA